MLHQSGPIPGRRRRAGFWASTAVRARAVGVGLALLAFLAILTTAASAKLLIPMDLTQADHLKAYGAAYHALQRGEKVEWLLNYRGGSFLLEDTAEGQRDCIVMGVTSEATGGGRGQRHLR
jgi:hypothetical protein